jgi:hypothetical protein
LTALSIRAVPYRRVSTSNYACTLLSVEIIINSTSLNLGDDYVTINPIWFEICVMKLTNSTDKNFSLIFGVLYQAMCNFGWYFLFLFFFNTNI